MYVYVTQGPKTRCLSFSAFLLNFIILHCICLKILFILSRYLVSNWNYTHLIASTFPDFTFSLSDSELTFADHISLLMRSSFYQLRRLRAIRRSVSPKVFLTIVHAFICTRMDYCNSLLIGFPKTRLAPVQSVLNAAARIIAHLPPYSHISDYMINELHWLPILARLDTRSCSWLLSPNRA